MKLLDKLKNTFFEEEYIEVDEPEVKSSTVAKKVEPKEVKKEEKKEPIVEDTISTVVEEKNKTIENYSDSELAKKDSKLPYFEDDDFLDVDLNTNNTNEPKKIYGESADKIYSSIHYDSGMTTKPYSNSQKEAFKPTPIISPIYGILDKNYRKEEVVDKRPTSSYVSRKNADLDSVRKKAYGEIDPLEEMSRNSNSTNETTNSEEENILYDMTNDHSKPTVNQVTLADAEEYFEDLGLEYNIDYKDSCYEKATGRRTSINNHIEEEVQKKEDDSSQNDNLEDNLFDLIDSMYEDGEE